jgi:hypothetical protein
MPRQILDEHASIPVQDLKDFTAAFFVEQTVRRHQISRWSAEITEILAPAISHLPFVQSLALQSEVKLQRKLERSRRARCQLREAEASLARFQGRRLSSGRAQQIYFTWFEEAIFRYIITNDYFYFRFIAFVNRDILSQTDGNALRRLAESSMVEHQVEEVRDDRGQTQ